MTNGLRIHDWDEHQTYRKDRGQPPWIKVHRELIRKPKWVRLSDAQKGQLVSLWILAADEDGYLPDDPALLRKLCYMDSEPDLEVFVSLGFIDRVDTAASQRRQADDKMTAQSALARGRGREEAEAEAELTPRAREEAGQDHPVFGCWNGTTMLALKGLYGWPPDDIEGTDERLWPDGFEWDERRRCLTIACQRLQGEGRPYHGKQFRRTLIEVIGEQTEGEGEGWSDVPL